MRFRAAALIVLFAAAAFGSGKPTDPVVIHAVVESCLAPLTPLERRCIFADFDGDREQDIAYTSASAHNRGLRSVTVHLAQSGQKQVVDLAAWPAATSVFSRDVDGDQDRDLVLAIGPQRPVAVFLNDGAGSFYFDSDEAYLESQSDDAPQLNVPSVCGPPLAVEWTASAPALVHGLLPGDQPLPAARYRARDGLCELRTSSQSSARIRAP